MRARRTFTRVARSLAAVAIAAAVWGGVPEPAGAILPTTTTLSSSANPAQEGAPVTITATVGISSLKSVLITPSGTVTFSVDGVATTTTSLTCPGLLQACTATTTVTAPPAGDPLDVRARYNGDLLTSASEGSLSQQGSSTTVCDPAQPCEKTVDAPDGLTSMTVSVPALTTESCDGDAHDGHDHAFKGVGQGHGEDGCEQYGITASYQAEAPPCATSEPGPTGVFDVSRDDASKSVEWVLRGSRADSRSGDPTRVCWGADAPFTTAGGGTSGPWGSAWAGVLPLCAAVSGQPPCVVSGTYVPASGSSPSTLTIVVDAPAGDPWIR